ncbi:MAG: hypothetical protein ACJ78Q_21155 [Chloroflexia bacterium]
MTANVTPAEDALARQGVEAMIGRVDERKVRLVGTAVAPISEAANREWAARLIKEGASVGSFVRSVWVLWIDPANRDGVDAIYRIKGAKRTGRPMGTTLGAQSFVEMLDPDRIAPGLRTIFLDPQELESRLGMLCLVRAPIRKSAAEILPPSLVSQAADGTYWLQNCVMTGSTPVAGLVQAMQDHGIRFPAVTSMNISGQPEIVDRAEAEAFCREHGVPLVLTGPEDKHAVRGSFPIIEVGPVGARVVREGQFPSYLFRYLLDGAEVELSGAAPARFPVVRTHSEEVAGRTGGKQLREEIIARLESRSAPIRDLDTPGATSRTVAT